MRARRQQDTHKTSHKKGRVATPQPPTSCAPEKWVIFSGKNPSSADNLKKYKTKYYHKMNILKIQDSDYKQDDEV